MRVNTRAAPDPTVRDGEVACAIEVRTGVTRELEREVTLDRRRQITRRSLVERPAAVVALVAADVLRDAAPDRVVALPDDVRHQDVLGVHRRVRLELGPPVPVRRLLAPEPVVRACNDLIDIDLDIDIDAGSVLWGSTMELALSRC